MVAFPQKKKKKAETIQETLSVARYIFKELQASLRHQKLEQLKCHTCGSKKQDMASASVDDLEA